MPEMLSLQHFPLHVGVLQCARDRLRRRRTNVITIILQDKIPANCDASTVRREGGELVIKQAKIPTHSDIAEAVREGGELVMTQGKIPSGPHSAKLLGQRSQITAIQVPVLQRAAIESQPLSEIGLGGSWAAPQRSPNSADTNKE